MAHGSRTAQRISLLALALVTTALTGCGEVARNAAPTSAQIAADFKGSPAPLAALHAQGNRILGGGTIAFAAVLHRLHGYPVVVNKWGSWCPNCELEMSIFQRVAAADGRRVAFLGDDTHESAHAGQAMLRRFPVTYPSFSDQSSAIAAALNRATVQYAPVTFFYNRAGEQVYFHDGPYVSAASLQHDIRLYLGA